MGLGVKICLCVAKVCNTTAGINTKDEESPLLYKSLTAKKQTTKFSSANFQKNVKPKLYHIENSKTRCQTA